MLFYHLVQLLFFLVIIRVISIKAEQGPIFQLGDPCADVIEKISVVGYDQYGTVVVIQMIFQPAHHLKVKMVCRLVQQHYVRLFQQDARNGDPCSLSAAALADGLIKLLRLKPKSAQNALYIAFVSVAAPLLKPVQHITIKLHLSLVAFVRRIYLRQSYFLLTKLILQIP